MEFVLDHIYWIIIAAAGLVQWWRSTQEAKQERENHRPSDEYLPKKVEEFLEQMERRQPKPATPPPLPRKSQPTPPRLDRAPAPSLKKVNPPNTGSRLSASVPHHIQQAQQAELDRQAAIAEQIKNLKQAKKNQEAAQTAKREKQQPVASGSIRDRLKNRSELRQAFVMKEFLEKPVGLR